MANSLCIEHGSQIATISKCHPEPFGVAQDKLREGSKVLWYVA